MVLPTNIMTVQLVRLVLLDAQFVQLLVWPILVILVILTLGGLNQTQMPVQSVL